MFIKYPICNKLSLLCIKPCPVHKFLRYRVRILYEMTRLTRKMQIGYRARHVDTSVVLFGNDTCLNTSYIATVYAAGSRGQKGK